MLTIFAITVGALLAPLASPSDGPCLKIVTSKALPPIESVEVFATPAGKVGPQKPKPVATLTKFDDPFGLPGNGPYDLYAKPKGGMAVLVATKVMVKASEPHELKLGDLLGAIEVTRGDGSPRVEKIVVTATDDPGPDEKGHVAIQVGSDYRVEMPVTEGFYAVWLVPANGARAQRVADRLRVLPGKTARVGGD